MKRAVLRLVMATAVAASLALGAGTGPAPAEAARFVTPSGPEMSLEVSQGRLIRLDRPATSVFIADPEIADVQVKSPQMVYVFGKKAGETSLYAVDDRETVLVSMPIVVTHNLQRLRTSIDRILPASKVEIDSVDGSLVLTGTVANISEAEEVRRLAAAFVDDESKLINRLGISGPTQINLRVKIAEVKRDVVKRFGINWDAIASIGDFAFGLATGRPTFLGSFPGGNLATRGNDLDSNSFVGAVRTGDLDLNVIVDALEDEGLLTILAEPNLTAMSGETASFLAGGEFPIPVPQGNDTISIEFKKFGVSLAFTPTLLGDGRINLKVAPEVSQLTNTGSITINDFVIPALNTRRAETVVELGSGQSFAVAGLLQSSLDQDVSKVPGLGDVPILGALFRSDVFRRGETELVIIVTPYVVRPTSGTRMALPTDAVLPPNDAERIFGRKAYQEMKAAKANTNAMPAERRLTGPVGFMVE